MAENFSCRNGHNWDPYVTGFASSRNACPICGASPVQPRTLPETDKSIAFTSLTSASEADTIDGIPSAFGRYRIEKQLGRGGMGAVYLAHDSQLNRPVAMKIPRFLAAEGSVVLERFYREGRAAAMLRHANICPVYDVGELNGTPYLTMAFIEGQPLSKCIQNDGHYWSMRQTAALIRKLALALEEAHRQKIIHRDLKPDNIMMTSHGEPVIMDFGLARQGGQSLTDFSLMPESESGPAGARDGVNAAARLTQQGDVMGTPAYMSPEQARGDISEMGPSCDIYSLGVILYELLTGRVPFSGSILSTLDQLLRKDPRRPSELRQEVDPKLESICLKAMAKQPGSRFASMHAFAAALTEYLRSKPEDSHLGTIKNVESARTSTTDETCILPISVAIPSPARRRLWSVLLGTAVIASAAVLYFVTNHGSVKIESEDASAHWEIRIDDKVIPSGDAVRLRAGTHVLEAAAKDYKPIKRSITVQRGDNPPIRLTGERLLEARRQPVQTPSLVLLASPTSLTLESGKKQVLDVQIQRIDGNGTVQIVVEGLPTGVKSPPVMMREAENETKVELSCTDQAPVGFWPITVVARMGATQSSRELGLTIRVTPGLILSAIDAVNMEPGQTRRLDVRIQRKLCPGLIRIVPGALPDGVKITQAVIPATSDTCQLEVVAQPGAKPFEARTVVLEVIGDAARTKGTVPISLRAPVATNKMLPDTKKNKNNKQAISFQWPAAALKAGKIVAPDLGREKVLLSSGGDDKWTGWQTGEVGGFEIGLRGRLYCIKCVSGSRGMPIPYADPLESFACQFIVRLRGTRPADYCGFAITNRTSPQEGGKLLVRTKITQSGEVVVLSERGKANNNILAGPAKFSTNSAKNDFTTVLLIVKDQMLEVYVNGVAYFNPIALDSSMFPLRMQTGIATSPAEVELEQVKLWTVSRLPSAATRAAGMK